MPFIVLEFTILVVFKPVQFSFFLNPVQFSSLKLITESEAEKSKEPEFRELRFDSK